MTKIGYIIRSEYIEFPHIGKLITSIRRATLYGLRIDSTMRTCILHWEGAKLRALTWSENLIDTQIGAIALMKFSNLSRLNTGTFKSLYHYLTVRRIHQWLSNENGPSVKASAIISTEEFFCLESLQFISKWRLNPSSCTKENMIWKDLDMSFMYKLWMAKAKNFQNIAFVKADM